MIKGGIRLTLAYVASWLGLFFEAEREEKFRHLAVLLLIVLTICGSAYQWRRNGAAAREAVESAYQAEAARQSCVCVAGRNIGTDPEEMAAERDFFDADRENELCVSGRNGR